jgi:soluble lytic murein transglycosylase-like protein
MRTRILLKRAYHDTVTIPMLFLIGAGLSQQPSRAAVPPLKFDTSDSHEFPNEAVNPDPNNLKIKALSGYIKERFKISERKAALIVSEAFRNGLKQGLQPELILAVIAVESKFKEKAVSPAGARGLMQVLARAHPKKVKKLGGLPALYDPRKNISLGTHILAQYKDVSNGNIRRTLLRYNGSLGKAKSRYPDKVMRVYKQMKTTARLTEQLQLAQAGRTTFQQ